MQKRLYPAEVVLARLVCDDCDEEVRYSHMDFKRDPYVFLHYCEGCGRAYHLDTKYPCPEFRQTSDMPIERREVPQTEVVHD